VLEWVHGRDRPYSIEAVRAEYAPGVLESEGISGCIIEHGAEPVGFIQFYEAGPCAAEYGFAPDDDLSHVWACDLWIGVPELWGTGVGTAAVHAVVDHLFVSRSARRVLIDPRVANERAVRAYEKVGFRRVRVLPAHEHHEGADWDNWLMELDALDHPTGLTAALARIDSVNPDLVAGAAGEAAVSEFVERWCETRGLEASRSQIAPGRWNVVATRRGSGGGRSLLFNGHLDTVGVTRPSVMEVRHDGERLTGRGVLDTKGGLACALLAAASIEPGSLAGDVIVAAVADEEYASIGTEALVRSRHADAAVVLEPTDLRVVARHRGFAVITATFTGRPSHTSRPDRGANAIHAAARATAAVEAIDRQWTESGDDIGDRPSTLVSGIASNGQTFSVPPHCELVVEVRTTAADPAGQVQQVLEAVHAAAGDTSVHAAVELQRPPMDVGDDHALVVALTAALGAGEVVGAPYWTDAALHVESGTPAVVFGPTGEGLHEDLEWVTIDSLQRCTDALRALIRAWCA
jgi:acetylornithine deacetylase